MAETCPVCGNDATEENAVEYGGKTFDSQKCADAFKKSEEEGVCRFC